MALTVVLALLSLIVLTVGAEFLVTGAVALARRLRLSSLFIGLTIVGFGTSTPELFTSLLATARGQADISVGNVIGSNIFNIALILGLTSLISPIPVRLASVRSDVWLVVALACVPFLSLARAGFIDRWIGAVLLAMLVFHIWHGAVRGRRECDANADLERELETELGVGRAWMTTPIGSVMAILGGLTLLIAGSALLVESSTELARAAGVSELVIGLTIVAGGTSAPELFTSLVAAFRRQSDIAVGNILGSNVFNIAGILGLAALLAPQRIDPQVIGLDGPVMLGLSVALFPLLRGGRLGRIEGFLLLGVYVGYLVVLLRRALAPV